MSHYQLIALDMDGTLLNRRKEITPKTLDAIALAAKQGKHVILNTGRCPAELNMYLDILPGVRYLNCVSGALVYDRITKEKIFTRQLDIPTVRKILDLCHLEDCMPQFLTEKSIVQRDKIPHMAHYHMGQYQSLYETCTSPMEDLFADYLAGPFPVEKLNIYHAEVEGRVRTKQRLLDLGLPISMAYSEESSLEINPLGIDKGLGLRKLCEHLGIPLEECIVVGDADNDIPALQIAGLPIAMSNANDQVLKLAGAVVADNDHDGCAQAIYQYLLT